MMEVIQGKTTAIWQYMEHMYTPLMESGLNAQSGRSGATASVRCHSTLLKGHDSLAATLKLYQLIKHHTFHSYAYSQVHARLGIRTAIADYVHRVLNWPSREVKGRASLQVTDVCSLVGKNNISGEVFTVSICVNANSALPLDVT